MARASAAHCE